ncbi:MAG: nucleotide exchange factor GrpE, partial [Phormidesmis sp.]
MTRSSPRELASQKIQLRKQQEKLLSDLLTVMDALDRASEHWQQAEQSQTQQIAPTLSWWQQLLQRLAGSTEPVPAESLMAVVGSARTGIDMIRETLLGVLTQHQVVPLAAKGQPFDPEEMHALGQQADAIASPNTVLQEVVRGYRWKDRRLREAQVIVAVSANK